MSARGPFTLRLPELLPADDRSLLARFGDTRDEAAFAALVRRHAGMVLGVCRRAVRDAHLAEDAFQAVFLVLARNPAAAANSASVAGWLFGVARRVGLAARRHERRRSRRAGGVSPLLNREQEAHAPRSPELDDVLRVLDEELAALPEEYRAPLIVCYLREQTQDEAARELGWSLSTLRRRLDRAKQMLRSRLARRGAMLSAGLLAAAVAPSAAASVCAPLLEAGVRTGLATASPSHLVRSLAAGAVRCSILGKLSLAAVAVVLAGGLAVGFGSQTPTSAPDAPPPPVAAPAAVVPPAAPEALPIAAPAAPRDWVRVKGRVVFPKNREIPPRREIRPPVRDQDTVFANGRRVYDERVVIDPKTRGIRYVMVWLRPDADDRKTPFPKEKVNPQLAAAKPTTHTVTIECCQFEPRVIAARAGDSLSFKNAATIAHNVNYQTLGGQDVGQVFNVVVPPGKSYDSPNSLPASQFPDIFSCGIHPWMRGYVRAFDHPYSAVTAADGGFAIPDAPVGTWRLVVWHEKIGFRVWKPRLGELVTVADDGNGEFDLGRIELDSDAWDEKE
jgi:RNA polymerase sigma factor (sigma-70 family)